MQGFNMGRYVPPDLEGTTTTGNALHRKRPPGQRVRASDGTLQQTVRFEMPFAVWCGTCAKPTIIGQGVRFNATKSRAGQYHSTPIWSFRMRHAACGGEIEIRTDPQNTAYVVASGGRRRDTGDDGVRDASGLVVSAGDGEAGGLRILTDKEREEMRASAFKKLERTIEDREHAAQARLRIDEIEAVQARGWDDPYAANARLRKEFRVGRHEREKAGRAAEDLKDRMSLGIDLLPENDVDARRAALVDFRPADSEGADGSWALVKPLFPSKIDPASRGASRTPDRRALNSGTTPKTTPSAHKHSKRLKKSEIAAAQHRDHLVSEIVGNTRAASDPFLTAFSSSPGEQARSQTAARVLAGIKRKQSSVATDAGTSGSDGSTTPTGSALKIARLRDDTSAEEKDGEESRADAGGSGKPTVTLPSALVEYDS
ncbi:CWC16 protein, partial [Microdochium trichocladiopsis]